jgi:hypothetical protein
VLGIQIPPLAPNVEKGGKIWKSWICMTLMAICLAKQFSEAKSQMKESLSNLQLFTSKVATSF